MSEKIAIDCTGVEDTLNGTMVWQTELDYRIYDALLDYADLILNTDPEEYLKNVAGRCIRKIQENGEV